MMVKYKFVSRWLTKNFHQQGIGSSQILMIVNCIKNLLCDVPFPFLYLHSFCIFTRWNRFLDQQHWPTMSRVESRIDRLRMRKTLRAEPKLQCIKNSLYSTCLKHEKKRTDYHEECNQCSECSLNRSLSAYLPQLENEV